MIAVYDVEFEEVTVKIPKRIMDFFRKTEKDLVAWLEYTVVDMVRVELDGMTAQGWVMCFNLAPVFYTVLEDERYVQRA